MSNDILDLPDNKPKRHKFAFMGYAGLGIMIVGMVFRLLQWPFANVMVLAGGTGLVLRNVLIVFLNRIAVEKLLLYYLGHSVLISGIIAVWLSHAKVGRLLIFAAVGVFFIQFLWRTRKRSGE